MSRKPRTPTSSGYATTVGSALLISVAAAASLLAYIRLKGDLNRLEIEIGRLDHEWALRKRSNEKLRMDYNTLVSSAGLNARMTEMGLNLVMPGDNARVILPEPNTEPPVPPWPAGAGSDRQLASGGQATAPQDSRR